MHGNNHKHRPQSSRPLSSVANVMARGASGRCSLVCGVLLLLGVVSGTLMTDAVLLESNSSSVFPKGLSSNGSGVNRGSQWQWLSSNQLPGFVKEESHVLCLAHMPWCGLSRKLLRDVEQMVSAEPDRWPGLKLCKINGHKEPQLAATRGLLHQWPSVVFYLNGRAIRYPAKLAAKPMLEEIEVVMGLPSEDVPVRRISSTLQWKEALEKTEEVIVFYEQCNRRGVCSEGIEAEEVRWSNRSQAGESASGSSNMQKSDSGRRLEGCDLGQLCRSQHPSEKCFAETSSQGKGLMCPAQGYNSVTRLALAKTCPCEDAPFRTGHSQRSEISSVQVSKIRDQQCASGADLGHCSPEDRQRVDSLRLQIEELAWKALMIPSKLVLLQVTDPAVLEAAIKVETQEPRAQAPHRHPVGQWVDDVLKAGVLSFEASEGLLRGLSSSWGSFVGHLGRQRVEVEANQRPVTVENADLVADAGQETAALPVREPSAEGAEAIAKISRLPSLLIVQTRGRGSPKGFSSVSNLTALLQTVPGPLVEEARWDNIGNAFQENGPVVVLFLDLYSRVQERREESRTALETLRAVGESWEGRSEEVLSVAEKGSLLEGLQIRGSDEKDEGEESRTNNLMCADSRKASGEPSMEEEGTGSSIKYHQANARNEQNVCTEDETSETLVEEAFDQDLEENKEETSRSESTPGGEALTGGETEVDTQQIHAERPGYAKLKFSEDSSSEAQPAAKLEAVEPQATESSPDKKRPEAGQVMRTKQADSAEQSAGLGGAKMQALLAHLSDQLKGLPAGSQVEIEVHDVSQQGVSSDSVSSKMPEAIREEESQTHRQDAPEDSAEMGGTNQGRSEGGALKYVYVDGEEALLRQLGVEVDLRYGLGIPALAIIDPQNEAFYLYPTDQPLTREGIEGFLISFRGGKLQPSVKSERAPWLPPRLPKGSRVAFPVPSISAAALQGLLRGRKSNKSHNSEDSKRGETGAGESHVTVLEGGNEQCATGRSANQSSSEIKNPPKADSECRDANSREFLQTLDDGNASGSPRFGGEVQQPDLPPERDVLVLFTNNWCGFCQRAEVVLREVLRSLEIQRQSFCVDVGVEGAGNEGDTPKSVANESEAESSGKSRLDHPLLFRMDCDENDCNRASGLQITAFPTLLLFPGNRTLTPVPYQGAFRVQEILTFLKQ